ncbi:MAG TPA: histidine kinase [Noviherbaspirillum sp.]|uniref:hybrid sensor histidine kinase/response regulator n=1 Tax=Noviherbaspirillum sp. TaxID=1926288 RepID=UPI002D4CEA1B|nr:histidine kinase [Noviherbaspirillum sp.]HYD94496.1 histidine kinase [Noviherbaspirillum sp.]
MPPPTLHLLHVEDNADDADLLRAELEAAGLELRYTRVETAAAIQEALATGRCDAVVTDFNLPSFDAYGVLGLLRESGRDIPLIVVSGFIGEMEAVALMKAGANDYVMKDNLARLAPAIMREIEEAALREQRRQAQRDLEESQRQLQELSAFLQQVREEERTRIARELHDELGQALTALRIDLNWLDEKLPARDQKISDKLAAMAALLNRTVDAIRRISEDLRPGMLDDLGLAAAIEHHAAKFAEQTGIRCDLAMNRDHFDLDDQAATALFRVLQESLTNVARHSGATEVTIRLQELDNEILLIVKDNGCGLPEPCPGRKKTYGLLGMNERMKLLGGMLDISSNPGNGTRVEASIPVRGTSKETR